MTLASACRVFILTMAFVAGAGASQISFEEVLEKMEKQALDFAAYMEVAYGKRCEPNTFSTCEKANFAECSSVSPDAVCVPFGSGERLEDTNVSAVRIPQILQTGPDGNPRNPRTIESVCYSAVDDYFQDTFKSNLDFWKGLEAPHPQMYFGSESGAFRIYPARYQNEKQCGDFDPRVRPWYNAASSGPKNLFLILDVSGSMKNDDRISAMKDAAKVIINALTITDRVAVIPFSDQARVIADKDDERRPVVFEATTANKESIMSKIDKLKARGGTNFIDAFDKTLDVFQRSQALEFTNDCTTAVVFLTDGQMTPPAGVSEQQALAKITSQLEQMESKTKNPLFLFTYSVGDNHVRGFPKDLACSTANGVWSSIGDADEIFESLLGYNKLFALGIGQNEGFTAWVEPYLFSSNIMGVTVSAPVYDRTKSPPLLIGVVGVDNTLETFERLLALEGKDETFLTKIAERSAARCPRLDDVGTCLLQSYREQGRAGKAALCGAHNCSFVEIQEAQCPFVSDYPVEVLVRSDPKEAAQMLGMCDKGLSAGAITGIVFACLAVLLMLIGVWVMKWRERWQVV